MKVLFVLPPNRAVSALPIVEEYVFRLATALAKRGMSCYVLIPHHAVPPEALVPGMRILRWSECSQQSIRGILREIRPHVVQVENRPALIREIRQVFAGQLILNLHTLTHLSSESISRGDLRVALCLVDNIVLGSYYQKSLFLGRFFGLRGRTHVIYPGVDGEVFRPYLGDPSLLRARYHTRQGLGLTMRDFVILVVGPLGAHSGVDLLQNAVKMTSKARIKLVIVSASLDQLPLVCDEGKVAMQLPPSELVLVDGVSARDMPSMYRAADMCVCPSQTGTTHGTINLEAQSSGLPLVISLRGGSGETADKRWSYFVRRYAEESAWARPIALLAEDDVLRRQIGLGGREYAIGFSWEQCAGRFLSLYSNPVSPRFYSIS